MKRFLCLFLSAALLASLLTGCGKKQSDDSADDSSSSNAALTVQDEDTMQLNMLFSLMSTPDNGVTELLGDGNHQKYNADGSLAQREYDGIAYGQTVNFTVSYNEYGDVSSIYVEFEKDVTREQVSDVITELVGREANDDGTWRSDTATVSIVENDEDICIILEQYEVDSAEDPNQY